MAKMEPRSLLIDKTGRQHQSWNLADTGLVMTCDIRPDRDLTVLWGLYIEGDYKKKIKKDPFIQENLPKDHPDKFQLYLVPSIKTAI